MFMSLLLFIHSTIFIDYFILADVLPDAELKFNDIFFKKNVTVFSFYVQW